MHSPFNPSIKFEPFNAIKIQKDGKIETAVTDNMEYIKNETLATSLDLVEELDNGTVVEFDDVPTKLFIDKN